MSTVLASQATTTTSRRITITVWLRKCGKSWRSEKESPKRCGACKDPNWNRPRRWFKNKDKNARYIHQVGRLSRANYPEGMRYREELEEEKKRDLIVQQMYTGASKGMKPYTAIFDRDAIVPCKSFFNRPYHDAAKERQD